MNRFTNLLLVLFLMESHSSKCHRMVCILFVSVDPLMILINGQCWGKENGLGVDVDL